MAQQRVDGIAAIVDDSVITFRDVENRLKYVMVSAGMENDEVMSKRLIPQVLRGLIDETLQRKAAASEGITVSEAEVQQAVAGIEQQNNRPPGSFLTFLEANGIPKETALDQIRSQVAWSKLVMTRIRSQVKVSDDEVDVALERIAGDKRLDELKVQQILLTVDKPENEDDVRELAESLAEEARDGANFTNLVEQFSSRNMSDEPGEGRWLRRGLQEDVVEQALAEVEKGDVVGPVRAADGYHIYKILDRRTLINADPLDSEVAVRQVLFPLKEDAGEAAIQSALAKAQTIYNQSNMNCLESDILMPDGMTIVKSTLGRMQMKSIHEDIRTILENLRVGEIGKPFRTQKGIHLLMLCEKIEASATQPDREQVREILGREKLQREVRRYMRNLRRNAYIEIRM